MSTDYEARAAVLAALRARDMLPWGGAMYPPDDNRPLAAGVGDRIEHKLIPGCAMTVLTVRPCETDDGRPEPHLAYQVLDPESSPDWLCAYDVRAAGPEED